MDNNSNFNSFASDYGFERMGQGGQDEIFSGTGIFPNESSNLLEIELDGYFDSNPLNNDANFNVFDPRDDFTHNFNEEDRLPPNLSVGNHLFFSDLDDELLPLADSSTHIGVLPKSPLSSSTRYSLFSTSSNQNGPQIEEEQLPARPFPSFF